MTFSSDVIQSDATAFSYSSSPSAQYLDSLPTDEVTVLDKNYQIMQSILLEQINSSMTEAVFI